MINKIERGEQNWPENPDEVAAREADEARAAAAKAKREEKRAEMSQEHNR